MREYSQNLVIDILRKDYPEIDNRIRQRLNESLPVRLIDINLIPKIVSSFKRLKQLKGSINQPMNRESSEYRKLILAVIMLFYHPDKIILSTSEKTRYGILMAVASEIECSRGMLKMRLADVIVAFKSYKEFRDESYRLYELIKTENKFFQ